MEDEWNIHVGFEVYHFHYGSRGRNLERIVIGFSEKTLVVDVYKRQHSYGH